MAKPSNSVSYIKLPNENINREIVPYKVTDGSYVITAPALSGDAVFTIVSVSTTGTATTEAKYITINGTQWKLGGGGGTVTDVRINGTSILSSSIANFTTKTAYNSSTNKIVTESDLPQIIDLR